MTPAALLVAGYLTTDVTCLVPSLPGHDGRVTALEIGRASGGMAANCACAAARLGTHVRFFGHAGTSEIGDAQVAALEADGVDVAGVARDPGDGSFCVILVGPEGDRAIVSEPLLFDWTRFDAALTGGAAAAHVDGYRLADALPRAAAARARAIRTSIDLDGVEELSREAAAAAAGAFSILFLNRRLSAELAADPETAAAALVDAGADVVCVTLGAAGVAVCAAGGEPLRIEGHAVDAVDTTGAGDAFAGAFLHRLLGGADAASAAAFANVAAARSTTARGARGALVTQADAEDLVAAARFPKEVVT